MHMVTTDLYHDSTISQIFLTKFVTSLCYL